MDIGGSSTLDPTYMEVKESICGKEPGPARQVLILKSYIYEFNLKKNDPKS